MSKEEEQRELVIKHSNENESWECCVIIWIWIIASFLFIIGYLMGVPTQCSYCDAEY